ncbi:MAG: cyclic nucleotide-binding domain-containing protein [Actinomycetota bacterium]
MAAKTRPGERGPRELPAATVELLAAVPLFAGCSKRQLKQVASLAKVRRVGAGAMLAVAGAPGSASFAVLVEGSADVVRGGKVVGTFGPGDFFGEIGVIDGGRRTASVVATSNVVAIHLSRAAFRRVIEEEPGVAWPVMEALVARLRRAAAEAGWPSD